MTTDQTCQKQFLDKSSAQQEIRCFFRPIFCCLYKKFSTYCIVFLKLRYRDIVAFRTKNWMGMQKLVIDSLQTSHSRLWHGKTLSNHFQCPRGAINTFQVKVPAFVASRFLQCCQFGYFEAKFIIFGFFSTPLAFIIFGKTPNEIWLFGQLDFLCRFGRKMILSDF